jgi:diguanylate cyclase (GGDEF)-like protein
MALDPNEKKSQLAKRALVLLLIGLQIFTVLLIISTTRYSFNKNINQQISILLENAIKETKQLTTGFLEPSYRSVKSIKELISNNIFDLNNQSQLESYFLNQLKNNPEMNGIYFASPEGDFLFVSRYSENLESEFIDNGIPLFMTKTIAAEKPGKASFGLHFDSPEKFKKVMDQDDNYNPLERPWYQEAVANKSLIWTEPYIFFTLKKPGITVAAPLYSENNVLIGVVGIDISLTMLSDFFENLKIYGSISAFMVSSVGNFVAAPSMASGSFDLDTLRADEADDTRLALEKKAVSKYLSTKIKTGSSVFSDSFKHGGVSYTVRYEPFKLQDGAEWIMTAYAPEDEFLATIRTGENRNILIALLILAISLVIGWLLIRRAWQPFERFFHDVITDQLTGLFNRRFLENIGSRMYIRLLRNQHEFISIAVIDLDFFKKVNIEFGKSIGNKILIAFADFLKKTLRPEDIITRYSGDTFVVILPGLNHSDALNVVVRMQQQLDAWPLSVDDLLVKLSFSAGVETIDDDNRVTDAAFTDFIEVAKKAMKDAKRNGRDRVESANEKNYQIEK